jgi:hypothetical protein
MATIPRPSIDQPAPLTPHEQEIFRIQEQGRAERARLVEEHLIRAGYELQALRRHPWERGPSRG